MILPTIYQYYALKITQTVKKTPNYLGIIFFCSIFDQMGKKSAITRTKIIDTAMALFLEKGYDGVRMQELADKAGVNKGLLHHYFQNKQTLFNTILNEAFDQLFGKIAASLASANSLEDKINFIIDAYFEMLLANPRLPVFVLFELNKDPEHLQQLLTRERIGIFVDGLRNSSGNLTGQQALHVILTIASLSVFPFMARPIVIKLIKNEAGFASFIAERRPLVKMIVKNLVATLAANTNIV